MTNADGEELMGVFSLLYGAPNSYAAKQTLMAWILEECNTIWMSGALCTPR
eukprot:COSAG01_NODE_21841_length_882_cov_1.882503_1_plen_50_part_10